MRFAISAGHGKGDSGAINATYGLQEHDAAVVVCRVLVTRLLALGHQVFVVEYGKYTLGEKIRLVNAEHLKRPFAFALEIHMNSNAGTPGSGTEVLHYSVKNALVAARMSAGIAKRLGTKDRGAKKRDGLGWLTKTLPPSLIPEILFINRDSEAVLIRSSGFAHRVADGIIEGLGL